MPAPCDQVQHRNTACDSCTCPLDHSTTVSTARGYPLRTPACGPTDVCGHIGCRLHCSTYVLAESVVVQPDRIGASVQAEVEALRSVLHQSTHPPGSAALRQLTAMQEQVPSGPGLLNRFRPAVGLSSSPWSSMRATSDSALLLRLCVHAAFHIAHFVDELVRRLVTADTLS